MSNSAAEIAAHLAANAESVCRHYLFSGRRSGRYWLVGDVGNSRGNSLFVRLVGPTSGRGAAGRWRDAATGQHGDLLDLIQLARDLPTLSAAMEEARHFLGTPLPRAVPPPPPPRDNARAARRLFGSACTVQGTLGETYLRARAITFPLPAEILRFHPRCYFRADDGGPRETWPALLAAVTDLKGAITGVQRTYLSRDGHGKAPFEEPRRALGHLYGHAVRVGVASDVLIAGEGLETMLSLRALLPDLPIAAALSSSNLAGLILPPGLSRLYIALDRDPAGRRATDQLAERATASGITSHLLTPTRDDWNTALQHDGHAQCLDLLAGQLHRIDVDRSFTRRLIAAEA